MKRILKISALLHIVLLCVLLVSTHSYNVFFSKSEFERKATLALKEEITNTNIGHDDSNERSKDKQAVLKAISVLTDNFRSENISTGSNTLPTPLLKYHISDYYIVQQIKEIRFSNIITGYLDYAKVLVVGFPPSNISFPFSYFL